MKLTRNEKKIDSNFWNIVKGIGILSVVIGHTCSFAVKYVYLYHLVLFFFVSGYLFNEEKYGDDPYFHFASRLKSVWLKYVSYIIIFVLFHNLFLHLGIIINSNNYSLYDILINSVSSIVFLNNEPMGGALWFAYVLVMASSLFGAIIYIGRLFEYKYNSEVIKMIIIGIMSVLCGFIGSIICIHNTNLTSHLQISFLVIPFYFIAYVIKYHFDINRILNFIVAILFLIFLIFGVNKWNWQIDLSNNQIVDPLRFYLISYLGIYICLYLAKKIQKTKILAKILNCVGKNSFDIMALHFLVIKCIDVIYAYCFNINDKSVFGQFPYAFKECWLFYVLLGTFMPIIVVHFFKKLPIKKIYSRLS